MNGGPTAVIQKMPQSRSYIKTVLTVFFNWEGVMHQEYAPPGQKLIRSTTSTFFPGWERQYNENSRSYVWATSDWQLHQDNAPTHASPTLQSFLAKHQITCITQSPYSPDLAPCDSWFFLKLKSPLKRKRFQSISEIQENMTEQLMAIPTQDFAECFEQWKRCWENCVRSQAAYFEGDLSILFLCTKSLLSCIFFNKCLSFHSP